MRRTRISVNPLQLIKCLSMNRRDKRYRVVSLFSGAMGLDLGLDSTGRFELLACVEVVPAYCETIQKNVSAGRVSGNPLVLERDIASLSVAEFTELTGIRAGEVDLLVGGPPCQSFSTAGKRKTVQDPRGTLVWDYLRFVEGLRPKFFLMENVRGLLSAALKHRAIAERPEHGGPPLRDEEKPGSVVRLFASELQKLEGGPYHMDCFEVNAVNYGAPQLRERALFIGNRYNAEVDFPQPTHGPIDGASDMFSKNLKPWRTLGDAIGDVSDVGDVGLDFSPRKKYFLSKVPPGSNWRSLPVEAQKESMGKAWYAKGGRSGWWRRLNFDLPCPTLVTMPNHASTSLCHPTETRALSIKEYARIQEFPQDWEVCGTPSQQYAQMGNAVPTRLGAVAGSVLSSALDELAERRFKPRKPRESAYRIIYIQSHVRTRQWFKDGQTFLWEEGAKNYDVRYGAPITKRRERSMEG